MIIIITRIYFVSLIMTRSSGDEESSDEDTRLSKLKLELGGMSNGGGTSNSLDSSKASSNAVVS